MKLSATREAFLEPLQAVIGVVERRQTMPILANILISAKDDGVSVTATDLEVEMVAKADVTVGQSGEVTIPGRKLLDICRALKDKAKVELAVTGEKATVRSGRSRFTLATLPAGEFPIVEDINAQEQIVLTQAAMHRLLEKTHFSMAHQDVRYYLNGLLLEIGKGHLRAVATDGHRLALCDVDAEGTATVGHQVIVPRKGVLELQRLLGNDGDLNLAIGSNHIRAEVGDIRFTTKLIDGRFPDYQRVIPKLGENNITADREELRQALYRAAILSNEKYRGIRMELSGGGLRIQAHNPEQEEAEEEVEVGYEGDSMEIGFNVNYLLDALGALDGGTASFQVNDPSSSCLMWDDETPGCRYVVMPMRL
ncbi:MAG: DNA polymerase III subunit beta [Gammaproteobacteria bacterium]|nr:MAG: DNA polymerase III subunit beta [Gammaproteobacteria bacterium]